ncbi:hypothetical protein AFE_3145 [Acidithiobacillus ferrooxidans ATCC 23270]|uniref:Uncharacterized protein n=1 Tax=Acidithiobacillus ferrooxidans (strain ATCC 23270 / DSM 14882 / CIP 104768 / NCIMB 8455) TaxID=243159 RepID=B7JAP9_ACIF2|nr:hypothetical protein AFE_3145 [Acidithiobacillus ferrooxidans ATCC 23270]
MARADGYLALAIGVYYKIRIHVLRYALYDVMSILACSV